MDYTAHLAHLESQLVIADAHFAEEKARLVAELEGLYGEIEGLRSGSSSGHSEERTNGGVTSRQASHDAERSGSSRLARRQESAVGDETAVLRSTLDSVQKQYNTLEMAQRQNVAQICELQAMLDNLHRVNVETQRINGTLTQEKQELEEDRRQLKLTAQSLNKEATRLRADIAELKSDQSSLTVDHEILTGEHQDLSDEVVGLRAERRSLRAKAVEAEQRVVEEQRQRLEVEKRLQERDGEVQELETQLTEKDYGTELLRTRIAELEETTMAYATLQQENKQLREHKDAVEATHVALQEQATSLERTVEALTARVTSAEEATLCCKVDVIALTLERDSLAESLSTTQTEQAALQEKISDMERDKMRDDAVRDELQEQLVDVGHENTRLVGKVEELLGVRDERDTLQTRVSELEKEITNAQEAMASTVKEKVAIEGSLKTTSDELETLLKQYTAQKDSLVRSTTTEETLLQRQADLKALQKTTEALHQENKKLGITLAKMKAEHDTSKKELVPLRLERDKLRNDGKKVQSERNLLRHQLDRLRQHGGVPQGDAAAQLAALQAGHATALATKETAHKASLDEIARLHEEREEFKKYCEWVRPDRERLKEEVRMLKAAFEESEKEKKTLMAEVTRYIQQQDKSPAIPTATPATPVATPSPVPPAHAYLVEQLRLIDQEFTKYRTRVEAELAEGKSEITQLEMEKSMVEEEFARFREAQAGPKVCSVSVKHVSYAHRSTGAAVDVRDTCSGWWLSCGRQCL